MNTAQMLPDLKRISDSDSLLKDFVENFPDSCNVQDACTRKYLFTNHHNASWCGLSSIDDLIGLTPMEFWMQDISQRRSRLNLNHTVIASEEKIFKATSELGSQIYLSKRIARISLVALKFNGLIRCENVIKCAVQNHDKKSLHF